MKTMILTGLASEQRFGAQKALYYLVFNNGELRVPVTEQAAEVVIKEMYASDDNPENNDVTDDNSVQSSDDNYQGYQDESSDVTDEDGVSQV